MPGERHDGDHRQTPQKDAEKQQFESDDVVASYAATHQLDVHLLSIDADIAIWTVQSLFYFLHNFDSVIGLAQLTHLPLFVRVAGGNAWVDECCSQPYVIEVDERHCEDEEEGGGIFESVQSVQ